MAKKHKAPTQITIVHAEKSPFAAWVDRHWRKGAVLAVLGAVGILGAQYSKQQAGDAAGAEWDALRVASTEGTEALARVRVDLAGTVVEPWAMLLEASAAAEEEEYVAALEALARLRQSGFAPLTTQEVPVGPEGAPTTLADHLARSIEAQRDFDLEHADIFTNEPPPEGSPTARLKTGAGDIVVAFYEEAAPKHVENFLKLAREDFYDGVKFHRVVQTRVGNIFIIQAGDPNTKDGDIDTWGQGGPGYSVDSEPNDLVHDRGYLAAARPSNDPRSSGSQFYITTAACYGLDADRYVVYGKIIEGMDVVDKIAASEIREATGVMQDVPLVPVVIDDVVLE